MIHHPLPPLFQKTPRFLNFKAKFQNPKKILTRMPATSASRKEKPYDKHATVCAGLYAKMFSYPFVVDVVVLNKVMCLLQALSQKLQSSTINWYQAAVDIRSTLATVKSLPPDGGFLGLLKVTTDKIAEECGMPVGPAVGSFPIHTTRSSIASYY